MFLLDDILLSPVKGLLWVFREIHAAAEAAQTSEKEDITTRLSELYMELETGRIDEAEFDKREKALLDRLDNLEAGGSEEPDEEDSDEEASAEDDSASDDSEGEESDEEDSDEEDSEDGGGEDDTEGGERE